MQEEYVKHDQILRFTDWREFARKIYDMANGVVNPINKSFDLIIKDLSDEKKYGKCDDSAIIPRVTVDVIASAYRAKPSVEEIARSIATIIIHELSHLNQRIDKYNYIHDKGYREMIETGNIRASKISFNNMVDKFNQEIGMNMKPYRLKLHNLRREEAGIYEYRTTSDLWVNVFMHMLDGTAIYHERNTPNVTMRAFDEFYYPKTNGIYNIDEFYRFQKHYFKIMGFDDDPSFHAVHGFGWNEMKIECRLIKKWYC